MYRYFKYFDTMFEVDDEDESTMSCMFRDMLMMGEFDQEFYDYVNKRFPTGYSLYQHLLCEHGDIDSLAIEFCDEIAEEWESHIPPAVRECDEDGAEI